MAAGFGSLVGGSPTFATAWVTQKTVSSHLGGPTIDWVHLAAGMGVPGARAEDAETLVRALERAYAEPGPHLIEAVVA
jgi:thiamine pyrophosphate-dependent acetolactate synthase large subunit-like protein